MSNKFTSEVLSSGVEVYATANPDVFQLVDDIDIILLTRDDMARLSGIAFPTKQHACCKVTNIDQLKDNEINYDELNSQL